MRGDKHVWPCNLQVNCICSRIPDNFLRIHLMKYFVHKVDSLAAERNNENENEISHIDPFLVEPHCKRLYKPGQ